MIHRLHLFVVEQKYHPEFISTFREGVVWRKLSQEVPGYIFTDCLQSQRHTDLFLCIEFWVSTTAREAATNAEAYVSHTRALLKMTRSSFYLGVYAFPPPDASGSQAIGRPVIVRDWAIDGWAAR